MSFIDRRRMLIASKMQGGLPSIYQQCEYVSASGDNGAYIDLGFPYVIGGTAEIGFIKTKSADTDMQIFGAAENSGKLRFMLSAGVSWYATKNNGYANVEDFNRYWSSSINTEIILKCSYKNTTVVTEMISPVYDYVQKYDYNIITMTRNLYLLGQNYNTGYRGLYEKRVTFFKYWDKDDILVRDMIPCYRKSDGVIGMWDFASKTFFTNAGTGSFTKGADVN